MKNATQQNKIMPTLVSLLMIGLIAPLIMQVNYLARDVFLISEYKHSLNEMTDGNEGLKISLAQSSSLENIGDYIESKNFVKADQVKYVQILETSVVQNVQSR